MYTCIWYPYNNFVLLNEVAINYNLCNLKICCFFLFWGGGGLMCIEIRIEYRSLLVCCNGYKISVHLMAANYNVIF